MHRHHRRLGALRHVLDGRTRALRFGFGGGRREGGNLRRRWCRLLRLDGFDQFRKVWRLAHFDRG
jgi:hypothetical protein